MAKRAIIEHAPELRRKGSCYRLIRGPDLLIQTSMIERLVRHAEVIVIQDQSYRLRGKRGGGLPLDRAILNRP